MNGIIEGEKVEELEEDCGLIAEVIRRKLRNGDIIGLLIGREWVIPVRECERVKATWPLKEA